MEDQARLVPDDGIMSSDKFKYKDHSHSMKWLGQKGPLQALVVDQIVKICAQLRDHMISFLNGRGHKTAIIQTVELTYATNLRLKSPKSSTTSVK